MVVRYHTIVILHEWLVFKGENMVNVNVGKYAIHAYGIGWLCWLVFVKDQHDILKTTVGQLIFTGFVDTKKTRKNWLFFLGLIVMCAFFLNT